MLIAALCWALGTFATTRMEVPQSPFALATVEMLAGGAFLVGTGWLAGERLDPAARTNHGGTSRRLLGSGLFRCGTCGGLLFSGGSGSRGRVRYACKAGHLCRIAEPIDDLVRIVVAEVLVRDGVKLLPRTVDTRKPRMRAKALRARQDELASSWAAAELTTSQFRTFNERNKAELAEVEEALARLSRGHAAAGIVDTRDPGAAFRSANLDRQRAVIDMVVDVTVLSVPPGRGSHTFDPESVKIEPKAV